MGSAHPVPSKALFCNGCELSPPNGGKDALLRNLDGAYTTARTVAGRTAIFQLQMHMDRLLDGILPIIDDQNAAAAASVRALARDKFYEKFCYASVKLAIAQLEAAECIAADQELQITWFSSIGVPEGALALQMMGSHRDREVPWRGTSAPCGFDVYTFVQPLPVPGALGLSVTITNVNCVGKWRFLDDLI